MKVIFRVDASKDIGSGHVIRCLTLAEELRNRAMDCVFICRNHTGNLAEKIAQHGFQIGLLPNQENSTQADNLDVEHASWLACGWQIDADQTKEYLQTIRPDWLVVDHYALDEKWERYLASSYRWLMVIDDIADRRHKSDLLLDQNLFDNRQARYQGKLPEKCIQLLGPQYALLQSDYVELRAQAKPRKLPLNRLLIFFGGSDSHNITGLTLSALEKINIPFVCVDVVISRLSAHYKQVKKQAMRSSKIQLHSDLPSLAQLMMKADLAIGAGGATNWERLCLGLPSLVITLADNQKPISRDLHQMGLIEWIGDVESIRIDQISAAIERVLFFCEINKWSERCMEACSGQGTALVADMIQKVSIKK